MSDPKSDAAISQCAICKGVLGDPADLSTLDCGGDCLRCMAVIGEDPECIEGMKAINPSHPTAASIAAGRAAFRERYLAWKQRAYNRAIASAYADDLLS